MFRTLTGFREIGVGGFQHGVLIAMPQLSLHGSVPLLVLFFLLQGAFETILVFAMGMSHG
jgi:hypothetical protein